MKWDQTNQVPIEGTYTPLGIPGTGLIEEVKKDLVDVVGDNALWQHIGRSNVVELLSAEGMTFDEYLRRHLYRTEDTYDLQPSLLYEFMYAASGFMSADRRARFLDIVGNSSYLWTIFGTLYPGDEMDLLSRVYFCESDEDFWDILLDGYGDPMDVVKAYAGVPVTLSDGTPLFSPARTASPGRLRSFLIYTARRSKDFQAFLTQNTTHHVQ